MTNRKSKKTSLSLTFASNLYDAFLNVRNQIQFKNRISQHKHISNDKIVLFLESTNKELTES